MAMSLNVTKYICDNISSFNVVVYMILLNPLPSPQKHNLKFKFTLSGQ